MTRIANLTFSFALSVLLGTSLACATDKGTRSDPAPGEKQENMQDENDQSCRSDSDCMLTPADCCGCNQGGKQRAINKKSAVANAKKRKEACAHTLCIQMISKDPSCKATHADCVKNICVLKD